MCVPMKSILTLRWLRFALAWAILAAVAVPARAELNPQEQEIFNLLRNDSGQRRPTVTLDPILSQVARARAADMADRGYFDHTDPSGHGPNWWVEQAGYQLPASYDHSADGNNIESASAGRASAGDTWDDWLGSGPHREHLLAQNSFYASQTSVGVGYVRRPGSDYTHYWVVLSAPPSGPQLAIKSPAGGAEVNEASIAVKGTTSGNPAAASVQVRVENAGGNGPWTNASGTASWSVTVGGLVAGPNTLRVRSLDGGGTAIKEATRNIQYVVMAPLTVQITGEGSVTSGFAGSSMRKVGTWYRITARPASGWIFSGWTGSLAGPDATANFVMTDGMSLTANFVPNPFLTGAGRYTGLFASGDVRGVSRLTLSSTGAFTGRLKFGRTTVRLAETFASSGDAQFTATGSDGKKYTVALHYDSATTHVTGSVSGPGWSAQLEIDHLFAPADGTSPYAGRYTLVISAASIPVGAPQGDGIVTLKVDSSGKVTGNGTLADGTNFSVKGPLTIDGELPVYAPLYNSAGIVAGSLAFRSTAVSDVEGTVYWAHPGNGAFPANFALNAAVVGSRYIKPVAGQPVVPVSPTQNNAELVLGDGGIGIPVNQAATLNPDNSIVISSPALERLSLRVNAASGRFTGRFLHPQTAVATRFAGVILQKQRAGFGFFTSGGGGGYATFAPVGSAADLAGP
jgi:uncharacterized repeat protein (TIGR02543 family)